jgi:homoserine O-succinyltransferase
MPIIFSKELPATKLLLEKRVFVMDPHRAERQDIRPLEIGILNLMPKKKKPKANSCV